MSHAQILVPFKSSFTLSPPWHEMYIEVGASPIPYGAREVTLVEGLGIDSDDEELHHAQLDGMRS